MSSSKVGGVRVAVVVPSLEPGESLVRLIESLERQAETPVRIVVVDQSGRDLACGLLRDYSGRLKDCTQVVTCQPGLSRARNVGIRSLGFEWDVVLLPDDDVWLDDEVVSFVAQEVMNGTAAGSGRLFTQGRGLAARIDFPDAPQVITPKNVWNTSIEACYFLTREFVESAGLYDESLGLGAKSPWQSGEGTDLLLRGMRAQLPIKYIPGYVLWEALPLPSKPSVRRRRLRNYGRGTGRVFARNYALSSCFFLIARSIARVFWQAPKGAETTRDNYQILFGRLEGLLGRVL